MNAAASRVETKVIAEDRIARIESDVAEIKDDIKTINVRLNDSIVANAREFGAVRAELAAHRTDTEKNFGAVRAELAEYRADTEKNFGAVRAEIEKHRTDTEKGFGGIRVEAEKARSEIEKVRTTIESAKLTVIVTGVGIIAAILGAATYLHTLKIP